MDELSNLIEEVWVLSREAAEIFGYSQDSMNKLLHRNARKPEDQREIRVRKRMNIWEMWLPDLYNYMGKSHRGPQPKRKKTLDKNPDSS